MEGCAQELFLLLTTLSQLNSRERIAQIFIEGMGEIFPGYSFAWLPREAAERGAAIEVCTRRDSYGYVSVEGHARPDGTTEKLMCNAAQLLGIFLERAVQEDLLRDQKNHLQVLVHEQTDALRQTNVKLEKELLERRRADRALRESEEKYRNLIQMIQAAVVVHGASTEILISNRKAQEILGLSEDQMLGKTAIDPDWHFSRSDGTRMPMEEYPVNRVLATRRGLRDYVVGVHQPTGEDVYVLVEAEPVWGNRDEIAQVIVTFVDITKRRADEEALRLLNLELDQRVAERTAQLSVANKELEAFAYSVSHDLRAPLRHIGGFLELLQQAVGTALDEQSRHYMEAISGATHKMGLLIDNLLAFSRMGRSAISLDAVDLGSLVQEIIRDLEPDAGGRKIEWCVGDLQVVRGDETLLRVVVGNLIDNAMKFTRALEQACIEIGMLPASSSEVVVFVRDNGVGFDMSYADKLFGVFQRLHHAEEFEGTGIGLASVRRIVARHGGRTWAEGVVNQGATFYFSLPRAERGA